MAPRFIARAETFGHSFRLSLGHTAFERRDGAFNNFAHAPDWPRQVYSFRFKYLSSGFAIFRRHHYPHGFLFTTCLGTHMLHVRVFWLNFTLHFASIWALRNRISI